jgi:hypothetical protein
LKRRLNLLIFLLGLTLPAFADYHPIPVQKGGTIRGVVQFSGETPAKGMFGTQGDPQCPAGIPQEHLLVRQENRGLKNALVVLDIKEGKPLVLANVPLRLKGCRFSPRLIWVPKSAGVLLTNADPTGHAVRALRNGVTAFAIRLDRGTKPLRRPLVDKGLYKLNCDRHLWERGWVYVSEHPYVAITDDHGRFELNEVPPGKYTLRVWHEGWVEKGTESSGQLLFEPESEEIRVTVRRNAVTEAVFDALSPSSN